MQKTTQNRSTSPDLCQQTVAVLQQLLQQLTLLQTKIAGRNQRFYRLLVLFHADAGARSINRLSAALKKPPL